MAAPPARASSVLDALGDATRRELLAAVGAAGAEGTTATQLAVERSISRQAIVKHLQVLAAAGLVGAEKVGREQRYRLEPAPLADASAWLTSVGAAWDRRLARLAESTSRRTAP
ncbi:MAG TPA: helix-turn-helix domain-containing protein [Aquihabitans sp.]|nr:helix-turn-helix domain-containing protein [Aquihabitans sp.]